MILTAHRGTQRTGTARKQGNACTLFIFHIFNFLVQITPLLPLI